MLRIVRSRFWLVPLGLSLALSTGCDQEEAAFRDAQRQDTIEAYEAFLTAHPKNTVAQTVQDRLDALYYERARTESSPDAYKAYLDRFPEGRYAGEVRGLYEKTAYDQASQEDSPSAYEAFLKDFPGGNYASRVQARQEELLYRDGQVTAEMAKLGQVTVDTDAGRKNGWEVAGAVKNVGDRPLTRVVVDINFLGEDGKPQFSGQVSPVEGESPLAPGESRDFRFQSGEVPEGWNTRQVQVSVADVKLAKKGS